jgi:hypothetical protein
MAATSEQQLAASISSVIWEQCVKLEKCVRIFGQKLCVSVGACLRLIRRGGTIILQVEAAGRQFEFNLTNACHTIFTVAIGYIEICVDPRGGNGVRIQARACIAAGPINQCWDVWGVDVNWLTAEEARGLQLEDIDLRKLGSNMPEFISIVDEFQPVLNVDRCNCLEG